MCEKLLLPEVAIPDRVKHFISSDPDGACQEHQISKCANGPVKDEELLARSVDFPLRDDHEGGLNDTLFQDAFTVGASVQRIEKSWSDQAGDIHARYEKRAEHRRSGADGRAANNEWCYVGAVQIRASDLRQIQLSDYVKKGRVRVYDSAQSSDDPHHGDVMVDVSEITENVKLKRKLLRVMLLTEACKRGIFLSPHLAVDDPNIRKLRLPVNR